MDLDKIDEMIRNRESRIDKRKADGTLFENNFVKNDSKDVSEDELLKQEVDQQKAKMTEDSKKNPPNCPQCGLKMTYVPEQSVVACQTCGIGMQV